jgi:hypothetical protein
MKAIDLVGYKLDDGLSLIKEKMLDYEVEIIKVDRDTYRTHESIFQIDERIINGIITEKTIII